MERTYTAAADPAASDVDEGLRRHMSRTYGYMSAGVGYTGALTALIGTNEALMAWTTSWGIWVAMIGVLVMGSLHKALVLVPTVVGLFFFLLYATLWSIGIAPSLYMAVSEHGVMIAAEAFLIATSVFAGASLFGYVTKKDLGSWSTFFVMASIGLLVAMLVNALFIQSDMMSLIVSCLVVIVFSGVAAWETQSIKKLYLMADVMLTPKMGGGDIAEGRLAVVGAFQIYGTFVTMFLHILRILRILRD